MAIQEEIFEEFCTKLEVDQEFPNSIIEELKKLWANEDVISQDKIFEAIETGCADVRED